MVGKILGSVLVRGNVRTDAPRILVEGVPGAQCGEASVLAELTGPVLALLLLDGGAVSEREGANVCGVHGRPA